mgnify:FL=1
MGINGRFGRPSTIVVPGGSSSVGARNIGIRNGGLGDGLAELQKYARQANVDRSNKELLRKAGVKPDIYDNADSATLSSMATKVGGFNVDEVESNRKNTEQGGNILKMLEGVKDRADATFQGFSPSQDAESLANMLKGNIPAETPSDRVGANVPRRQDPPQFPEDREEFGDEQLSHVQGLFSQVGDDFGDDPEAIGEFVNSESFKAQLTQAKARDRDIVAANVADVAAMTSLTGKQFQQKLDIDTAKINRNANEYIQIAKEVRAETTKKAEEARAETTQKGKEGRLEDTVKRKEERDKEKRIEDEGRAKIEQMRKEQVQRASARTQAIFNSELGEGVAIRTEDRAILALNEKNRKEGEVQSTLAADFYLGKLEGLSPRQAMTNALDNLSDGDRALIKEEQIKRLGKDGVLVVDLYNPKTGNNEKVEFELDENGHVIVASRKVIGASRVGVAEAIAEKFDKKDRSKLNLALLGSERQTLRLERIQSYLNAGGYTQLNTMGRLSHWRRQVQDRTIGMSAKDQLALRRFTQMSNLVGQTFTSFRKEMTGVAGSTDEFERLEKMYLSVVQLGPVGFQAALDLLFDLQDQERAILQVALNSDKLQTEKSKAAFRESQALRMTFRINGLKKDFGPEVNAVPVGSVKSKPRTKEQDDDISDTLKFLSIFGG